jgi:hypothetical protein
LAKRCPSASRHSKALAKPELPARNNNSIRRNQITRGTYRRQYDGAKGFVGQNSTNASLPSRLSLLAQLSV